MAVVGRVQDRDVRAVAYVGQDLDARVVDHLGADRAGRPYPADKRPTLVEPVLDGTVIAPAEPGPTPVADVAGDHHLAVVATDDTLAARELDQDRGHRPILRHGSKRDQPAKPTWAALGPA
jgi:hypothetical protein